MLYLLMVSLGMVYIAKYGTILNVVRKQLFCIALVRELLNCSLCLGFWVGILLIPAASISLNIWLALLFPFASAAWCWSLDALHDAVVCACKQGDDHTPHHEDIID